VRWPWQKEPIPFLPEPTLSPAMEESAKALGQWYASYDIARDLAAGKFWIEKEAWENTPSLIKRGMQEWQLVHMKRPYQERKAELLRARRVRRLKTFPRTVSAASYSTTRLSSS
jgi:hypothetical protein